MSHERSPLADVLSRDFMSFAHLGFQVLNPAEQLQISPYLPLLAAYLEAVERGEITRLVINLPPRSLKSLMVSVAFPAWLLGRNPSTKVIAVSYAQSLADKLSRDTRALMNSADYQRIFDTRLSSARQAVEEFETTVGGYRMATSTGGVLTGRGADYLILDDPQKPGEILSEAERRRANEWFDSTFLSRLNDKRAGRVIIVMQRLHIDDLTAHALTQGGYTLLSLSSIAVEEETYAVRGNAGMAHFHRSAGAVLQPERETPTDLERMRAGIGEVIF